MNNQTILTVLAIGVVALVLSHGTFITKDKVDGCCATITPESLNEMFWRERISKLGPNAAYKEFTDTVAPMTPQVQHKEAHYFGGALFLESGIDALSTCDNQFSYGCFHEFLGRAISTHGLSSVDALNERCFEALSTSQLSCQHGIGHGIMAYLGYGYQDLERALKTCGELKYADPIGGCYGGVFMEYNMRTMLADDATLREPSSGNLFSPCDTIGDKYKPACLFWGTQWWEQILRQNMGLSVEDAHVRMGELCEAVGRDFKQDALVRKCFEGIGNNLPSSVDFDGRRSALMCEKTSSNWAHQVYCKSYAANSLFSGGGGKKGDAGAVCEGLDEVEYNTCMKYANNTLNISNDF